MKKRTVKVKITSEPPRKIKVNVKEIGEVQEKSIEIRLRNTLKRRGYILKKSRRRDPMALDYGLYWITDKSGNVVSSNDNSSSGITLDEVNEWVQNMGHSE